MPGARSRVRPPPASESSVSDEACQLELHLQRQFEEDIARIFDESIYSDLEVVSGKLKILTHSCILKTRTNKFYHKLETILHANIGRNTFDEIYSFISDAYTECNIKYQEKEIIKYLEDQLQAVKSVPKYSSNTKIDAVDADVFLTPKCGSPYTEKSLRKSLSSSPSTDLTKEYYALVPIEGNLLEKELIEQDALSNAFQSIIKSQTVDLSKIQLLQRNKPTSLSITSSHIISKSVKHSNSCDILDNLLKDHNTSQNLNSVDKIVNASIRYNLKSNISVLNDDLYEKDKISESTGNRGTDPAFSPDSLITDDPSSSSDYLSAAYNSPGASTTCGVPQINVGDTITRMENTFTSSDSGLENTGLLESLSSHKDITLTDDVSLTESTLHDLIADEANDSVSGSFAEKNQFQRLGITSQSSESGMSLERVLKLDHSPKLKDIIGSNSSKEAKQRQNEDIVILESSSLSSETGSWESVFPPKVAEKNNSENFICNEGIFTDDYVKGEKKEMPSNFTVRNSNSLIQKSPFKSTSCFIDAASLVDEEDDTIKVQTITNVGLENVRNDILPAPSQPLPCTTAKFDVSPNDWSESNDNEDSLEQADNKDPDSVQKDLSPTIFEMTPITEDSLCTNAFENEVNAERSQNKRTEPEEAISYISCKKELSLPSSAIFVSDTPNNSILSLEVSALKKYDCEENENDILVVGHDSHPNIRKSLMKYNESSPIVSGGASIEDHLPQMVSHSGSPLSRRKIENMPIVSGAAFLPPAVESKERKSTKSTHTSAWIVDMGHGTINTDEEKKSSGIINSNVKKPGDRTCEILRNGSKSSLDSCHSIEHNKSRSSVDSDSSEKSSHKFYIDLSSLPDPNPPKNVETEIASEKKNIFSMYIDLGEKPKKEMPARLSASITTRKTNAESKSVSKTRKSLIRADTSFKVYESLCNDPDIALSEIINNLDGGSSQHTSISNTDIPKETQHHKDVIIETCQHRSAKSTIKEEAVSEEPYDLFVKLSDLDKPVLLQEKSPTITEEKVLDVRMTRSIPENTWGDQNNPSTSRSIDVISSFHSENALSLNRLFPHLKNDFSRSMPGSLSGRTCSPMRMGTSSGYLEEQGSEMSEMSSVQSSICRSVIDNSTTEDTSSLIGNCQSRLGQDLLRMFLQEIAPDVIVEVSGRRIKAHKCILSSRCQYFAGILSGGWVESAGNVIILPPFSYNVVHFALCHIYSGLSTIPDTISIVELATIADMLGLEGLKEAIMFTLKAKYCHHFHRPCQVCTAGVLECFPLSSVYGLDDLYRKCLKWITKYFSKVWPTKAFATLPKELLDICYQQHIVNLSIGNIFDTIYGCGITVSSLQNSSRWADSVANMCQRLMNATALFASTRMMALLRAGALLPADGPPPPAHKALDDCFAAAIEWAKPEEACRAYAFLSALNKEMRIQQHYQPDLISNGNTSKPSTQNTILHSHADKWRTQCEGALMRNAPRVVGTQAYNDLSPELRKRLRELGCFMYGPQSSSILPTPSQDRRSKSIYTVKGKPQSKLVTHSLDIDHVRASLGSFSPKPVVEMIKSNNDIRDRKIKGSNPPKIRTTKAQEERARYNLSKNNQSQDRLNTKIGPNRINYGNTKPRYLEPRVPKEVEMKKAVGKKLVPKIISSSESSRNSSPIQARNARKSRMKSRQESEMRAAPAPAMSQDSLATTSRPHTAEPSTDSFSESQNIYATYTKLKHTKSTLNSINLPNDVQTSGANNKIKTKIPVYLKNGKNIATSSAGSLPARARPAAERKPIGSLMNATKSSSAKIVPKVVKETISSNTKIKKSGLTKHDKPFDIPVMERSGTFLKDEPTFGDKTTNIDIDLD